ncbi:unnamed protein product, partial [Rotaria sp. Silwood2]
KSSRSSVSINFQSQVIFESDGAGFALLRFPFCNLL